MLTATELTEQANDYRRQAQQAKRVATSFKDKQDRERLAAYVEELEREAALLEALAEERGSQQ